VRHTVAVARTGFRLRISLFGRVWRTAVLVLGLGLFVSVTLSGAFDVWWRIGCGVAALLCLAGLRILWGSVVVVSPAGLRIQRNWPLRRDVRWYRILSIDVIPGFWHLEVELNSGERLVLPTVEDIERLYDLMERHRQALDA